MKMKKARKDRESQPSKSWSGIEHTTTSSSETREIQTTEVLKERKPKIIREIWKQILYKKRERHQISGKNLEVEDQIIKYTYT